MAKKTYSPKERAAYHQKRMDDPKMSANKKLYSDKWLDGYTDSHAKVNYSGVCSEIKARGKKVPREYKVMLNAYRNGLKAQLDSKK